MPISKHNRHKYPPNWSAISAHIRFVRAGNRCEWCKAWNYKPHPVTGSKVILTVAHLDHNPRNCDYQNLKALCQRCHNNYDKSFRAINRKVNKAAKKLQAKGKVLDPSTLGLSIRPQLQLFPHRAK